MDIGAFEAELNLTTVTLAASVNPSVAGQPVTFTATVAAQAPGLATPTGSVTFKDGTTVLMVVPLNAGKAVFTIATIAPGVHAITANHTGDAIFNAGASTPVTWPVFQADTITTLAKPAPSGTPGMMVLSAKVEVVAPGSGDPRGP